MQEGSKLRCRGAQDRAGSLGSGREELPACAQGEQAGRAIRLLTSIISHGLAVSNRRVVFLVDVHHKRLREWHVRQHLAKAYHRASA